MALFLLLIWAAAMLFLARFLCGNWLNHLSLYTIVWTSSLGAYELSWIRYTAISLEAWLYIFLAWVGLYLGTAVIMLRKSKPLKCSLEDLSRLKFVIILFSLAGLASCAVLAREIMKNVDSNLLVAVTVGAPQIYQANFEETGQFAGIPYLGFLPLAASALAGAYAARKGSLDLVSIFPISIATLDGILSVSRWLILFSVVLFLLALYLTPKPKRIRLSRVQTVILALVGIAGLAFVSVARTDLSFGFGGQGSVLTRVSDWIPFAPSVYFYLSAPPVGLSEYLQDPRAEANLPWGRYTFASIYRLLSKVGLATYVPYHQEFYNTPEPVNTCTYIREIYSDFGALGVFVFPVLIGVTAGWLLTFRGSLARIMALTHIYFLIVLSSTSLVMSAGAWFQSFIVSLIASLFLARLSRSAEAVSNRQRLARTATSLG